MPKPKSVIRKRKQAEYRKAKLHSEFYRKHQRDQEKEEKEIAKDPVAGRRMKFYESIFGNEASSASELTADSDKAKVRKPNSVTQTTRDPFADAKRKYEEHVQEKERKEEEIQKRKEEAKQKQAQRKATSAKLRARTSRGQPIMKYQVKHLLGKVKQRVLDNSETQTSNDTNADERQAETKN